MPIARNAIARQLADITENFQTEGSSPTERSDPISFRLFEIVPIYAEKSAV